MRLNSELPTVLERIINRALEKDRELRYQHASDLRAELQRLKRDTDSGRTAQMNIPQEISASLQVAAAQVPAASSQQSAAAAPSTGTVPVPAAASRKWTTLGVTTVIVLLATAGLWYWRAKNAPVLTEKDTIVLADFTNTTGDPVFDGSLKQALAISLQQSPFLSLLSDEQIQQTLRFMDRAAGVPLNQEVAREVCQRKQSKAMLAGSISAVGTEYLLGIEGLDCQSGKSLVHVGANAASKEKVLQALGHAASELRAKLGESLALVQKYDTPIEDATTSSLEALKTLNLGLKAFDEQGSASALPYFKRAILNRFDEARAVMDQGLANGIDPIALACSYYLLAFLKNDANGMQKQSALAMGKPSYEDLLLSTQSDTDAFYGRLKGARESSRRATESAKRNGTPEVGATWAVNEALREAEFGNSPEARRAAASAIKLSERGRYVPGIAALALARAGDTAQAQKIADALARNFPQDTFVNS